MKNLRYNLLHIVADYSKIKSIHMQIKTILIIFFTIIIIQLSINMAFPKMVIDSKIIDYREEMRNLVILISTRAREINKNFIVIPQNAMELAFHDGKPDGMIVRKYLSSIDGVGCEELFYGHSRDGRRTSKDTMDYYLYGDYLHLKNCL